MQHRVFVCITFVLVAALIAGCAQIGSQPTPVPATKTPKPTFTPTPDWTPTPLVLPTATEAPPTPTPEATATPEPTPEPPTPTPVPVTRLSVSQAVNIRSGPGTAYPVIGRLTAGQSFEITGKNPAGDWLQFELDGRQGWVIANLVNVSGDLGAVEIAQNIPAPPAAPTARPTARPQPTTPPQPTAAPAKRYEFNIAVVQRCDRQPAGNWFEGTVYKGGQPFNGARVVFSYAPDGPHVTQPQISGPHEGYTNWNPGFYSHIINASQPQAATWYVWIVDPNGTRISEMASWQSTGPGDGCNQAVVDFDSR